MTSNIVSSLALPHTNLVTHGKSVTFIMLASPYVNLGFEVIYYFHVGVTMKIKYCILVKGN